MRLRAGRAGRRVGNTFAKLMKANGPEAYPALQATVLRVKLAAGIPTPAADQYWNRIAVLSQSSRAACGVLCPRNNLSHNHLGIQPRMRGEGWLVAGPWISPPRAQHHC